MYSCKLGVICRSRSMKIAPTSYMLGFQNKLDRLVKDYLRHSDFLYTKCNWTASDEWIELTYMCIKVCLRKFECQWIKVMLKIRSLRCNHPAYKAIFYIATCCMVNMVCRKQTIGLHESNEQRWCALRTDFGVVNKTQYLQWYEI